MLDTAFNLLLIVLGFGVLIFVHELGHFLAARWAGIRTEVFAIGMGTPVASWRKGVGFAWGSTHAKVVARTERAARELSLEELERYGIGATEYSLRWLPIGGFVKMLGQDDADPSAVSQAPGSYNVCPVGKRMVVVSAGVVANVLLALLLFIIAFMSGVKFEAPVVGAVSQTMPAGTTPAVGADRLPIPPGQVGLQPGDRITHIDGEPVRTFVDVAIGAAMAKPGDLLDLRVERPGLDEPLEFRLPLEKDPVSGLLAIGIEPGRSNRLFAEDEDGLLARLLTGIGLFQAGVRPGMRLVSTNGAPVETYGQLEAAVDRSDGRPVATVWESDSGETVRADVEVEPAYQILRYATPLPGVQQDIEYGLFGLTPLVEVVTVGEVNRDVLQPGDVFLRAGSVDGPRLAVLRAELARHKGGEIDLLLLRGGEHVEVNARVNRKGQLNFIAGSAVDTPLVAKPMEELRTAPGPDGESSIVPSPVSEWLLLGGSRLESVNDTPVADWASFREALRTQTRSAMTAETGAALHVAIVNPTPKGEREIKTLELSPEQVAELHALAWTCTLPGDVFEPLHTTLTAGGNPLVAAAMGVQETHKVMVMAYLTIDRLVRGTVGVEQIHGPVGIVQVGTRAADRGLTYLIFFLGIISANLAVINFLPIPIVDGGLFLFLIYEKLKGRPPSLAFQNAAAIVGIALIATVFLVVTWNDLVRLVG